MLETLLRRPLTLHLPDDALATVDTCLKQTTAARGFRRAPAVRDVVQGQRLHPVSDPRSLPYAALRQGVHRFASQGTPGRGARPRPGRPPNVPGAWAQPLQRRVEQAPLPHGALHAHGSGRALAPGVARETGVQLGRERVRGG
jgi:hypothetical protein